MHIICKEVKLALLSYWSESQFQGEPFYLSKKMRKEIDQELSTVFPPDEVKRTPRTSTNLRFWKAAELKFFKLIYGPILLRDRLPGKYYQHYLLFMHSIRILLKLRIFRD